eukprot:9788090-Alexandrium_andersonii.AAC.1
MSACRTPERTAEEPPPNLSGRLDRRAPGPCALKGRRDRDRDRDRDRQAIGPLGPSPFPWW